MTRKKGWRWLKILSLGLHIPTGHAPAKMSRYLGQEEQIMGQGEQIMGQEEQNVGQGEQNVGQGEQKWGRE